jgi:hypothetical protein
LTTASVERARREAWIEEQALGAKAAPEPGSVAGTVFHHATEDMPATVGITGVESAGYVWVYDRVTGEPDRVNSNMVKAVLRTGRVVTIDPGFRPAQGKLKCPLHPNHPQAEANAEMGFGTCPKANLRTGLDVRTHMQSKHKRELAAIEDKKAEDDRERERRMQEAIIAQSMALTQQAAPRAQAAAPVLNADGRMQVGTCEDCGEPLMAKSLKGKAGARWTHEKECPAKKV